MTTAAKTLISAGFRQLELNRIQATVATENYPSQAVCDRLGLKKEGILRQAEWVNDHFVGTVACAGTILTIFAWTEGSL